MKLKKVLDMELTLIINPRKPHHLANIDPEVEILISKREMIKIRNNPKTPLPSHHLVLSFQKKK